MAAGFAKRMRPMTDDMPKPLLFLGNKPLLTHILDHLKDAGVTHVVINGHHCIDKMHAYISQTQSAYPDMTLTLSAEDDILETGGGAVLALQYLEKNAPFYMINGDAYWINPPDEKTLCAMETAWRENNGDLLLLLQHTDTMSVGGAIGDYIIKGTKAYRSHNQQGTHMFAGVRIVHPRLLDGYRATCFSFLDIMDKAEKLETLYAYEHKGEWYHISTPGDLAKANEKLFGKTA